MSIRKNNVSKYRQWFGGLSDEQRWRLRSDWPNVYEECEAGDFEECKDILELCIFTTPYYSVRKLSAF